MNDLILFVSFGILSLIQASMLVGFLFIGLKWAKVSQCSRAKAWRLGMFIGLSQIVLQLIPWFLSVAVDVQLIVLLFSVVAYPVIVLKKGLGIGVGKAMKVSIPVVLLLPVLGFLLTDFIFKPYVFEAYKMPTNSMAPTIRGVHITAKCQHCDESAIVSVDPRHGRVGLEDCICERFHYNTYHEDDVSSTKPQLGDGVLVSKLKTPKRWDIIIFDNPDDNGEVYAQRLVGLPGESVQIKGGAVFIDGQELVPPAELREIRYESDLRFNLWAGDKPAQLTDGEYFVLGDNTRKAFDSRSFRTGFAIPEDSVHGVVTHRYWPFDRWHSFP